MFSGISEKFLNFILRKIMKIEAKDLHLFSLKIANVLYWLDWNWVKNFKLKLNQDGKAYLMDS